jgi:hypothetical protein
VGRGDGAGVGAAEACGEDVATGGARPVEQANVTKAASANGAGEWRDEAMIANENVRTAEIHALGRL